MTFRGMLYESLWVLEDVDDGVASQKHLRDETALGDCCSFFAFLRHFGPDFLDVLHDHVHVAVEGLHFAKQLLVIAESNQHFVVGFD